MLLLANKMMMMMKSNKTVVKSKNEIYTHHNPILTRYLTTALPLHDICELHIRKFIITQKSVKAGKLQIPKK